MAEKPQNHQSGSGEITFLREGLSGDTKVQRERRQKPEERKPQFSPTQSSRKMGIGEWHRLKTRN